MYDLASRTALVTGGAQGIGFGIAVELARAGSRVVIASRNLKKAIMAADEIRNMGREAIALELDVTNTECVQRGVAEAITQFSRIDILVNNAGIFQSDLGLELSEERFNQCLDSNLTGIWRMVRVLVPHFRSHGGGKIVNIASVGGRQGVDFAPAYCASKAAVINLSQSLAASLGGYRINVNTVCPGFIPTAMQGQIQRLISMSHNEVVRDGPGDALPGPLTPADIGHAVVFLVSDYARNITGQALNVDCGYLFN